MILVILLFSVEIKYYILYCWLVSFATSQISFIYLHGSSINHLSWDFPTLLHRSTVSKAVVRVRLVSDSWWLGGPKSSGPKSTEHTGTSIIARSCSLQ